MSEHMSPIPSRLYNAAVGGHVCGPEDVDFGQKVVHLIKYDRAGNEVSFESQVTQANKIYVIHDDFTLSSNVTIPSNCVLEFEGGSVSGAYTITLQNTYLEGNVKILCNFVGTITNNELNILWFGIERNSNSSQQVRFQKIINLYSDNVSGNPWDLTMENPEPCIYIPFGEYIFGNITLRSFLTIKGQGKSNTVLKNTYFTGTNVYHLYFYDITLRGSSNRDAAHSKDVGQNDSCAFKFSGDCAFINFKNVAVSNHTVGFSFYNTYMSSIVDVYINYCSIGISIDGADQGAGGMFNIIRGDVNGCTYGIVHKQVSNVIINGVCIQSNINGLYLQLDTKVTYCYFEGNTKCIVGTIINTEICGCYFAGNTGYIDLTNAYISKINNNLFPNTNVTMIGISGTVSDVECYRNDASGSHNVVTYGITNIREYSHGAATIKVRTLEITPPLHTSGKYYSDFAINSAVYGTPINIFVIGGSTLLSNSVSVRVWMNDADSGYIVADEAGTYTVKIVYATPALTIQG